MAHAAVCPTFGGCDIDAPVKDAEHLREPLLQSSNFLRPGSRCLSVATHPLCQLLISAQVSI